jgi:hypothetical protein
MYFDRILFSAVFATLFGTAALALVPANQPAAEVQAAAVQPASQLPLYRLEPVVVIGKKDAAAI